jgi:hypothetical protein
MQYVFSRDSEADEKREIMQRLVRPGEIRAIREIRGVFALACSKEMPAKQHQQKTPRISRIARIQKRGMTHIFLRPEPHYGDYPG